jgi:hypothetical protein
MALAAGAPSGRGKGVLLRLAALGVAVASTIAGASVEGGSAVVSAAGFGDAFLAAAVLAGLAAVAAPWLLPPGRPPATDGPAFAH